MKSAHLRALPTADWQNIEPSIIGEPVRARLDPNQRAQLGAHYASESDIKTFVEPVLMAPCRANGSRRIRREIAPQISQARGRPSAGKSSPHFKPSSREPHGIGPGLRQWKFSIHSPFNCCFRWKRRSLLPQRRLGLDVAPQVTVQQLRAIELNAYAFELAQVSVQIGYLQWRRDDESR